MALAYSSPMTTTTLMNPNTHETTNASRNGDAHHHRQPLHQPKRQQQHQQEQEQQQEMIYSAGDELGFEVTLNPFDDDCETSNTTFNTTMNLSVLSDDVVPDVLFPSNIIDMDITAKGDHDNDDESETDFDGVVELAEDYFEVVVVDLCTIDQNDNSANPNAQNNNEMLESLDRRGDLYFSNNIAWESYNNQYETVERFVSPF